MRASRRNLLALTIALLLFLGGYVTAGRRWFRSSPKALAAAAREAVNRGEWAQADLLLRRLSSERSPTVDDTVLRSQVELAHGRAEAAIRLLNGIPDSAPEAAAARLVAGQIEMKRNRARPAESLFVQSLQLDGRLALARRELIKLYAMQARRADLNTQFRALAQLEPLQFEDVLLWTASLEDIWANDTIQADLERYISADPDDRASRLARCPGRPEVGSSRQGPRDPPAPSGGRRGRQRTESPARHSAARNWTRSRQSSPRDQPNYGLGSRSRTARGQVE